jgi:hypothetical protein
MDPNESSAIQAPDQDAQNEAAQPAFYDWIAGGSAPRVRLDYDFVDQLNFEVMRGFGAVPRRGAEVGGILMGRKEEDGAVLVTAFHPVPCRHARGPSYLLEEDELASFEQGLVGKEPEEGRSCWAVGFYRSNTRDALDLTEEDRRLLDRFFPGERDLCLMVKPYATRVSEAIFFHRTSGDWVCAGPESVIPFRRRELGGGKRPRRQRPVPELLSAPSAVTEQPEPPPERTPFPLIRPVAPPAQPEHLPAAQPESALHIPIPEVPEFAEARPSRLHGSWVWIPLSFVFLLLGIVLGFQIALSVARSQKAAEGRADPYSLELSAVQFGESLHLKWNSALPAFRDARSGLLHIQDGNNTKTVEITRDDIARGGILYKNATKDVRFRLEIPRGEHNSISENLDVHLMPPASGTR